MILTYVLLKRFDFCRFRKLFSYGIHVPSPQALDYRLCWLWLHVTWSMTSVGCASLDCLTTFVVDECLRKRDRTHMSRIEKTGSQSKKDKKSMFIIRTGWVLRVWITFWANSEFKLFHNLFIKAITPPVMVFHLLCHMLDEALPACSSDHFKALPSQPLNLGLGLECRQWPCHPVQLLFTVCLQAQEGGQ